MMIKNISLSEIDFYQSLQNLVLIGKALIYIFSKGIRIFYSTFYFSQINWRELTLLFKQRSLYFSEIHLHVFINPM